MGESHTHLTEKKVKTLFHETNAHLRSDVVRCSTEGLCGDPVVHVFFAHAEVGYLYMALRVQHHVVQLQITEREKKKNHTHIYVVICSVKVHIQARADSQTHSPIHDAFRVKEEEPDGDLGCIESKMDTNTSF